jgi:hypothetical protein|tara:strand:+ start:567 stop:737 length:171 start_codon:yes stop_codon:yes gene_type:complete
MTTQQIAWARKHDWFIESIPSKFRGKKLRVIVKDDMVAGNTLVFTDFDELKQWAGY